MYGYHEVATIRMMELLSDTVFMVNVVNVNMASDRLIYTLKVFTNVGELHCRATKQFDNFEVMENLSETIGYLERSHILTLEPFEGFTKKIPSTL